IIFSIGKVKKMKRFVLFAIMLALVFLGCSSKKGPDNDLVSIAPHGKVKSIREMSFSAIDNFGKITPGERRWENPYESTDHYDEFNPEGKMIESSSYGSDGNLVTKGKMEYDSLGNQVETIWYDSNGKQLLKTTTKFDTNGNGIESIQYLTDGTRPLKTTRKFNESGNLVEILNYDGNGNIFGKIVNNFDESGNVIESTIFNSIGARESKYNYKYDNVGNKIEANITVEKFAFVAEESGKYTYEYDNGNMVSECDYGPNGILELKRTFKYEFDEKGNWIRKTIFINQIPSFIVERELEYYE
nr:RHS repeat protein [Bacteroidia bacterium]